MQKQQKKQSPEKSRERLVSKPKLDLSKFKFRYDNVLVRAIREETVNGLVKPGQYDDKPEFGEVVAIGQGRVLENGQVLAPNVKVGDVIFFGKYSSEQTRNLGHDFFIIKEEDIKAVL